MIDDFVPSFFVHRVCKCWLYGQKDPDAKEPIPGTAEDGGAEEERNNECGDQCK